MMMTLNDEDHKQTQTEKKMGFKKGAENSKVSKKF